MAHALEWCGVLGMLWLQPVPGLNRFFFTFPADPLGQTEEPYSCEFSACKM